MSTDETYEGWANRETWAVALHINNDQGMQERVRELVTDLDDEIGEALIVKHGAANVPEYARRAGDVVKDYVEDLFDGEYVSDSLIPMMRDIGSLWRVDWTELGAAFLADVTQDALWPLPCGCRLALTRGTAHGRQGVAHRGATPHPRCDREAGEKIHE
jgi:hypothetical protein